MRFRKLRIAFSSTCLIACVLLIALSDAAPPQDDIAQSNSLPSSAPVAPGTVVDGSSQPPAQPPQAGIGVALRVENGKVFVSKVLPDTPAAQSGSINANDQVLGIAEGHEKPSELLHIKDVAKVVGMIRGPLGSIIRLSIIPAGKGEANQIVVSLVRGNIKPIKTFIDGRLLPVGSIAPNFKFTPLAHCEKTELAQLQGRIVVVDFWASWCGPCVKSLSDIDLLQASHPEWADKVSFVAVNVDDTKEKTAELISKNNWSNVSLVWAGPDVLAQYRVAGLPTVYVIDQDGRVVAVDHRLDIPALITPLLKQPNESHTPRSQ
jgi:thiol-disulfide isomerase/thioredoxin